MKHLINGLLIILALSTFVKEVACTEIDQEHSLAASTGSTSTLQDVNALVALGLKYELGQGVDQNYIEAVRLYTLAAEQGYADGQFNLGRMYELEQGVNVHLGTAHNHEEAVRLYTRAAEQGHGYAPIKLSEMVRGVKKGDQETGGMLYETKKESSFPESTHNFEAFSPNLPSFIWIRTALEQSIDIFSDFIIDNIWAYFLPISIDPLLHNPHDGYTSLCPGVYESNNIELILSTLLSHFRKGDVIVFDVDEVLLTKLNPLKEDSSLSKKLSEQAETTIDKVHNYMHLSSPWALMDERLPALIKALQKKGIICIANTASPTTVDTSLNIDFPKTRIKTLRNFGINFSTAFPHILSWYFGEAPTSSKASPLFKEGVIFSSVIPKHSSLLELLNIHNPHFKGRIGFIDDLLDNVYPLYEVFNMKGIECYSFLYTKKHSLSPETLFPKEIFDSYLRKLEVFLEKLLGDGDVDDFFRGLKSQEAKEESSLPESRRTSTIAGIKTERFSHVGPQADYSLKPQDLLGGTLTQEVLMMEIRDLELHQDDPIALAICKAELRILSDEDGGISNYLSLLKPFLPDIAKAVKTLSDLVDQTPSPDHTKVIALGRTPQVLLKFLYTIREEKKEKSNFIELPFSRTPDINHVGLGRRHDEQEPYNFISELALERYFNLMKDKNIHESSKLYIVDLMGSGLSLVSFYRILGAFFDYYNIPLPQVTFVSLNLKDNIDTRCDLWEHKHQQNIITFTTSDRYSYDRGFVNFQLPVIPLGISGELRLLLDNGCFQNRFCSIPCYPALAWESPYETIAKQGGFGKNSDKLNEFVADHKKQMLT